MSSIANFGGEMLKSATKIASQSLQILYVIVYLVYGNEHLSADNGKNLPMCCTNFARLCFPHSATSISQRNFVIFLKFHFVFFRGNDRFSFFKVD